MTIKLTLVKSLIYEAVKNETFLRGQLEKAANDNAIAVAYHEQAGDEAYQLRLLQRSLYANLSELQTHLIDYLTTGTLATTGDNNISSEESGDNIVLMLNVSERFNPGFASVLAQLCSKYVEEGMLVDWWKPVNEKQAALYAGFLERDLAAIKRCFNKTAPIAPVTPYTSYIQTTGSAIEMAQGETATVTYELSDGAIDDIECKLENEALLTVGRTDEGFTLTANHLGHTYIQLYSRHDNDITATVHVFVTNHS